MIVVRCSCPLQHKGKENDHAAAILGFLVGRFFGGQAIWALAIGGASLIIAALLTLRVEDRDGVEAEDTWHPGFPKSSV